MTPEQFPPEKPPRIVCFNCGEENDRMRDVCFNCGSRLWDDTAEPTSWSYIVLVLLFVSPCALLGGPCFFVSLLSRSPDEAGFGPAGLIGSSIMLIGAAYGLDRVFKATGKLMPTGWIFALLMLPIPPGWASCALFSRVLSGEEQSNLSAIRDVILGIGCAVLACVVIWGAFRARERKFREY